MMTELIRRVKFRCIPKETSGSQTRPDNRRRESDIPPGSGLLGRQTSRAEKFANELSQGAER